MHAAGRWIRLPALELADLEQAAGAGKVLGEVARKRFAVDLVPGADRGRVTEDNGAAHACYACGAQDLSPGACGTQGSNRPGDSMYRIARV
jgi:hypothetical protein